MARLARTKKILAPSGDELAPDSLGSDGAASVLGDDGIASASSFEFVVGQFVFDWSQLSTISNSELAASTLITVIEEASAISDNSTHSAGMSERTDAGDGSLASISSLWSSVAETLTPTQSASEIDLAPMAMCGCAACLTARGQDSNAFNGAGAENLPTVIQPALDIQPAAAGAGGFTAGAETAPSYATSALISGYKWGSSSGTTTVTYSFLTSVPNYYSSNAEERSNFIGMNAV